MAIKKRCLHYINLPRLPTILLQQLCGILEFDSSESDDDDDDDFFPLLYDNAR